VGQSTRHHLDLLPLRFPGRELLTRRECEVLLKIIAGASNKEIGGALGISRRTVEVHRANIKEKVAAKNTADLIRIIMSGGSSGPHGPDVRNPDPIFE
jgi:DNA-binding CsgD family transcriptional regulator